ncbi:ATP synthase j chain-domain-containing protein [Aspergillus pseudotamarii]|uniref:ATP synthase j chain-domain-containing protein n=1 Tax=Aspergillus pseudotamarii TaxID=132259 RepID=A0A5N6TCD2_ASPPS|nr:ATP synthase j chain-domain-containing protein [Aspergillus pseudotamarii]KAE8144048.1 ATP synthase j chain-domain-containing protein [Aspergillus pseudotamarii]
MSLLGKKFPTPIAKPLGPFFAAGAVILYGINSLGNALMNSEPPRSSSSRDVLPL